MVQTITYDEISNVKIDLFIIMDIHTSNISQTCSIMIMEKTDTSRFTIKNVNHQINKDYETRFFVCDICTYPIIEAIRNDDIDEVRRMIKIGANVNCEQYEMMDRSHVNSGGKTALTVALFTNLDIAKLLIDNGVDIDRSANHTNPSIIDIVPNKRLNVHKRIVHKRMNALRLLVDHDADLTVSSRHIITGYGRTFLHVVDAHALGRGHSTEFDAYVHKLRTRKKWNCSNHHLYPIKTRISICTFIIIMNGDNFNQNLNWDVMDKIMKYVAYGANNLK